MLEFHLSIRLLNLKMRSEE